MRLFVFAIITSLALFSACNKAGSGGKAYINVHVVNDNVQAEYSLVNLKYGATGFPGAGASWNEKDTADHAGKTTFSGLRKGSYYVYVEYNDNGTLMQGGATVKITNRIGEQHVVIDVSEGL